MVLSLYTAIIPLNKMSVLHLKLSLIDAFVLHNPNYLVIFVWSSQVPIDKQIILQ